MSALVCPTCKSSYRAGFTRCHTCHVDLVDPARLAAEDRERQKRLEDPREALASVERESVVSAGLKECRIIEAILLESGVPAYVEADADEGEPLSTGAMRTSVVIAKSDLMKASEVLRGALPALAGVQTVGLSAAPIDLSAAEIECPACGHKGALQEGLCGDCGLFLGAPE